MKHEQWNPHTITIRNENSKTFEQPHTENIVHCLKRAETSASARASVREKKDGEDTEFEAKLHEIWVGIAYIENLFHNSCRKCIVSYGIYYFSSISLKQIQLNDRRVLALRVYAIPIAEAIRSCCITSESKHNKETCEEIWQPMFMHWTTMNKRLTITNAHSLIVPISVTLSAATFNIFQNFIILYKSLYYLTFRAYFFLSALSYLLKYLYSPDAHRFNYTHIIVALLPWFRGSWDTFWCFSPHFPASSCYSSQSIEMYNNFYDIWSHDSIP